MTNRLRSFSAAAMLVVAMALAPVGTPRAAAQDTQPARRTAPATRPSTRLTTRPATRPADPLEAARQLYMTGKYPQAAREYEKLISEASMRLSASIGLAEALAMQGKCAEAEAALNRTAEEGAEDAGWHLALADVLETVGRYEEALAGAVAANTLRPKWAPTILARGRLLETLGRKKDAVAVYRTMEDVVAGEAYRQDARSLVALGRILDRFAVLTGRRASEQAPNILGNYLQRAYHEADRTYWPAHVAAGAFLLSKHNPKEAMDEFGLAAKLNDRIPDIYVGRGVVRLEQWRFEDVMRDVGRALAVNPKHTDALLLKAVCLMQWRKYDQVPAVLDQILKVNPNHLDALSLAAARHICLGEGEKATPFIERVRKVNAAYAELPNTIGEWLAAGRQFEEAERYYREAMALAPELAGPVTSLGLLYMQTGEEDKAHETLARARELDDYRRDVYNYLKILAKLRRFQVRQTEHFIIKVDGEHDAVLLDQVAEYAEQVFREVCGDFDHEPPVRTLIEIFPTHGDFSVRITGKGWIGTVGACTGRVIVLAAPDRERGGFGTYNWATVIRHEFTHTVTLSATRNRIPHWFTEACAVWEQPDRRNYDAVQALVIATRQGRLFPIRELNWGFIRPKRLGDRSLAYAQSEWLLEYIIATRKYPAVIRMLEGFRDGLSQAEVFRTVLGTTEEEFDKGFGAWAKKEIERWGFPSESWPTLASASAAVRARPSDASAHADLAVASFYSGRLSQAEAAAREALKLDGTNTRAMSVLATVLLSRNRHEEAITWAKKLDELDRASRTAPAILARGYLATRRWLEAIEALEVLKQRKPLDDFSYSELAKLYTQLGQPDKALPNLIELHRRTMKDPQYARQIAELYRTQPSQAERALEYLEQVVHIDPYEASAYKSMASLYINLRRYAEAAEAAERMALVQPKSAEAWTYVAIARYYLGQAEKSRETLLSAKSAAEKALTLEPDDSRASRILKKIEQALAG